MREFLSQRGPGLLGLLTTGLHLCWISVGQSAADSIRSWRFERWALYCVLSLLCIGLWRRLEWGRRGWVCLLALFVAATIFALVSPLMMTSPEAIPGLRWKVTKRLAVLLIPATVWCAGFLVFLIRQKPRFHRRWW